MRKFSFGLIYSFLLIIFLCCSKVTVAQDSSRLRISLLTCTPGDELYATFGHSAIRVTDSNSVTDVVYNYGTFNFDDEGFYIKFARGKLLYFISAVYFKDFLYEYQSTNRGMTEQVLNLTANEKHTIQEFLNNNLKEENRYYQYDFFFDNCTTRLRDIIKKNLGTSFTQTPVMPKGTTFRQAIHQYLDKNNKQWSKLGIDILLGRRCDSVMTPEEMQFLPDNLMKSLDTAGHQYIVSSQNLYPLPTTSEPGSFFTPMVVFCLLLVIISALSFLKQPALKRLVLGFDGLLFFLTGVLGIILLLMWFYTDHSMTKKNFNLLWAWPTNIIIAFFVNSNKNWVKRYFALTSVAWVMLLVGWFFLKQQMNVALIPLVLLMIYRSATKVFFEDNN